MNFKKGDKIKLKGSFIQDYGYFDWVKTLVNKTLTIKTFNLDSDIINVYGSKFILTKGWVEKVNNNILPIE